MKLKNFREIKEGAVLEAGTSIENKTGGWKTFRPEVDFKKCIHCMRCVIYCPDSCIPVKDKKRLGTNLNYCKGCAICEEECPIKCIKMVRK
ncbi:MAG: 4Fe-4S binding protein [Nanoarchaeota archaeon]|nr:4Fe-4S binding protein [Nanoarchaeota archaeon]MBU0963034.1 4Fe-4S binding protein [Nanoarchaeota archaeon]